MKYAAVVAAAGLSSRMHEFKPLLSLGGETMIRLVIRHLREAGVGEIVVVAGYKADLLRAHLKECAVTVIENQNYAETKMFDSLCLGIRALREAYDVLLLTPGDVPLVDPATIVRMMETKAPLARPVCGGRLGHPVMIEKQYVPGILAHSGERGLLGAVEAQCIPVLDFLVEDTGTIMDADTPEDFAALQRKEKAERGRELV